MTLIQKTANHKRHKVWPGYGLACLLGGLTVLAFSPFDCWPTAFIAPAILLCLWSKARPKVAFYLGWFYGIGLFGVGISWINISIHRFGMAPLWFSLSITALFVLVLGLFYALVGYFLRRHLSQHFLLMCLSAFPALWTTSEWLRAHFLSGFSWLCLGYSQSDSILSAFAPVIGVYGITLVSTIIAGSLVCLVQTSLCYQRFLAFFLLMAIFLCALGLKPIHWAHKSSKKTRISLIQGNISQSIKWQTHQFSHIINTYWDLTQKHWNSPLIIWPEGAIPLIAQDVRPLLKALRAQAIRHHSRLLIGIFLFDAKNHQYFNGALLLGQHNGQYLKRHLVPFGEYFPLKHTLSWFYHFVNIPMSDLTKGPQNQPLLRVHHLKIAPYICYEIAFSHEVIATLHQANLIVVLTDDSWFGSSLASAQHLQIAKLRAEETQRYLVFSSNGGPSAIISPQGIVEKATEENASQSLSGFIYPMQGITPYMHWGCEWVWLVVILMILTPMLFAFLGFKMK